MRTTIELDDKLFRRLKLAAVSRGISLKKLVEHGAKLALKTEIPVRKGKRVKLPLFKAKTRRVIHLPEDIAYRAQLAEDLERHAASCRH
jgi:beta-lactamase regulating signal transducer with metallopeptidase domain